MAEGNSSAQEKTEQATPKRLMDARKKGDVPRSRELVTSGVMLCGAGSLLAFSESLGSRLAAGFSSGFHIERTNIFDADFLAVSLAEQTISAIVLLTPLLAISVIAAIGFSVMLGGASFSFSVIKPKFEKINPAKGLKRMFGLKALIELSKSVAKVALIVTIAVLWLRSLAPEVMRLKDMPMDVAVVKACWLAGLSLLVVSSALIVGAVIDVPWQLYEYSKKMKMTKQEVRDESKETDGRPEVRQRIRQAQQEAANRRMMDAVPYADVIITNPTHFAVALRYDNERMAAPEVVAKGQDNIAAKIREIATEHKVTMFSAPPLARSLYHSTKVGQAIPAGLYTAVAQVLAYIFQLRDPRIDKRSLVRPDPYVDEKRYTRRGQMRRSTNGASE
ncbi:MAG: flagellar biosynthesis protein FlhB [Pseudomonadota bacterium]